MYISKSLDRPLPGFVQHGTDVLICKHRKKVSDEIPLNVRVFIGCIKRVLKNG